MKLFKSIRSKLFLWYIVSLISVTAYFYIAVHVYALPYGNLLFLALLLVLALAGLYIIHQMTSNLMKLSAKIRSITSKNLNEKVKNIDSEDEIGELADDFNMLLSRLDEAFKRESQFIGDIAHELKTPLSSQRASIELILSKERSTKDYKEGLSDALTDSNRIIGTLKNILDLAWSQTDDAQKGESEINLSEVVLEIKEMATKLAYEKKIKIRGTVQPGIKVIGRRDKLSRALLNIVDNAVKFTSKGGQIKIELKSSHMNALLTVKDNGIGISKKELPHVFDRFYRGAKTDKTFGSGLGLAITNAVIKAHKGTITVTSKVGKGSTFTVFLPLHS